MPVEDIADIVIAHTGQVAIIVGYLGVHRLDLVSMTTECILVDNRTERRAVIDRDGTRAAVFDHYAPCLHVFDLEAGTCRTETGSKKQLRARMKQIGRVWNRSPDGSVRAKAHRPLLSGQVLRGPAGAFKTVRAVGHTPDGRVLVAGEARTGPRADEPRLLLAIYTADGTFLGQVGLARRAAPASHVYVDGQLMSVDRLKRMGVTVSRSRSGEAERALTRFVPSTEDGRVEVPFGRLANGVLARLDVDAPLGDNAYTHEQPTWIRPGLRGEALPPGPDLDAAEDSGLRFRFWAERTHSPKDLAQAYKASARIAHLMPELAHRLDGLDRKAWRQALQRNGRILRDLRGEAAEACFEAMCRRVECEALAAEVAEALGAKPEDVRERAGDSLVALRRVLAALAGETTLDLRGTEAAGLAELAAGKLPAVERLILSDTGLTSHAARAIFAETWTGLQHLDLSDNPLMAWVAGAAQLALRSVDLRDTRFNDTSALALAESDTLPAVERLRLPDGVEALGRAALHYSDRLPAEIPGDHAPAIASLLTHGSVSPAQRTRLIRRLIPADAGVLRVDPASLGGLDVEQLAGRLNFGAIERVELVGCTLSGALLAELDGQPLTGLLLSDCVIDAVAARALIEARNFERCVVEGGELAVLAAILLRDAETIDGIEISDSPSEIAEALARLDGDAIWRHAVDATRRVAPEAIGVLFAHADALVEQGQRWPDRVEWMIAWPEAGWAPILGRMFADGVSEVTGEWTAYRGIATVEVKDGIWRAHARIAAPFVLGLEPRMAPITRIFQGQDVLSGDAEFDALARIEGDQATVLRALDPDARALMTRALPLKVRYDTGEMSGPWPAEPALLGALIRLHARWQWQYPELARLIERLAHEPVGGVRARLVGVILASRDLAADDRAALLERHALDADEAVRVQVAEALWALHGDEPLNTLSVAGLAAVLDRLEGARRVEGIQRLGREGDERCIPALTRVGTGLLVNRTVRAESKAAIEAITTRLGGLRSGGLSITEQADGGLSVSAEED